MRTLLLIIFALLLAETSSAQSPKRPEAEKSQQKTDANQRGTEQAPFIVQIITPPNGQNETNADHSQPSNNWLYGWFFKLGTSDQITAIIAAVGFAQFGALIFTVCVMRRTAYRQLRAYISVEPWGINPFFGRSFLIGHIRITNTGKIPAKKVSIFSTISRDTDGERTRFDLEDVTKATTALQPRAKMQFGSYKGWEIPVQNKVRDQRIELDGFLYVWGRVTYTDSFGTRGWTNFCHRYPCEMFGREGAGHHSIDRQYGRYHEYGGNEVD